MQCVQKNMDTSSNTCQTVSYREVQGISVWLSQELLSKTAACCRRSSSSGLQCVSTAESSTIFKFNNNIIVIILHGSRSWSSSRFNSKKQERFKGIERNEGPKEVKVRSISSMFSFVCVLFVHRTYKMNLSYIVRLFII